MKIRRYTNFDVVCVDIHTHTSTSTHEVYSNLHHSGPLQQNQCHHLRKHLAVVTPAGEEKRQKSIL